MIGVGHPAPYSAAKSLRQMTFHVPNLVQLVALDDRVIEHVDDCLAQRLGAVEADQHRTGDIQAPLTQIHQQVVTNVAVSVEPSTNASGCLSPLMSMPSATMQHDSAKCTPSIISASVQPGQVLGKQLGQRGFSHRREFAGDRRLACRRGLFGDLLPDQLRGHRFHESRWSADVDAQTIVGGPPGHCEITDADPAGWPGGLGGARPGVDRATCSQSQSRSSRSNSWA